MTKQIDVTDHDYDRLIMRAGSKANIKFIICKLLNLSDQAAIDIRKWEAWCKAVANTNPPKV